MPHPSDRGYPAVDPKVLAEIVENLRTHWDSDGVLLRAAVAKAGSHPTRPRDYDAFATEIAGILGAGGSEAEVAGYLRREEERLLGVARSTGPTRWPIAQAAWRAVRGISLPRATG